MLFGSVCGDAGISDSGSGDAGVPTDVPPSDVPAADPCVASDGRAVARYCRTEGVVHDCRNDTEMACRSDQHCESYLVGEDHHASCYFDGSAPCDLEIDPPASCDGSVITVCQSAGGPVPTSLSIDCRELLGWDDATCVGAGEAFRCSAPLSTSCDPDTDAPRCDGSQRIWCRPGLSFTEGPVWVRESCGVGFSCFDSRIDGRGVCLGSDATPTAIASGAERCADEITVRLSSEGYLFSFACPLSTHFTPDGEVLEQGVCVVDGLGGHECLSPRDVEACSAGAAPVCAPAGAEPNPSARVCVAQGDGRHVRASHACLLPFGESVIATSCDAGVCDHVGGCALTDPPACVSGVLATCDPETLRWSAELCPSACVDGACT